MSEIRFLSDFMTRKFILWKLTPRANISFLVFCAISFVAILPITAMTELHAEEASMKDGIPWQEIKTLQQLESHLEQQAILLGSKEQIRDYLENSGFKVGVIPVGSLVMRLNGFNEPGVSVQGTRDPSEIDGPLGRWWRRTFAYGLFVSVTISKSGNLVSTQALYNYE
ncbi:hypothetical protein [Salaquimonas pukyongi]|uniref:hypothetical protein n=1 Tax=Salaquimonas pukyongi TaxID=2712698 RepID=UPI00096B7050|nr:hypothetical protein [Salaquimonas pukyongi]